MPRDTQQQKVYRWEDTHVWPHLAAPAPRLSLEECERLVRRVFHRYGQLAPKVHDGGNSKSAYWSLDGITLPHWARTTYVVLHECAHGLQQVFAPNEPAHGAAFMGLYLTLLHRFGKVPLRKLKRSAQAAGLQVVWAAYCEPPDFNLARQLVALRNQAQVARMHIEYLQQQPEAIERQLEQH